MQDNILAVPTDERETAWTSGPWEACEAGDYGDYDGNCVVVLGDDIRLAVVLGSHNEALANAHLIAAAPDLYEALEEIRDMLWSRPDISDRLRPLMGFAEEATNQKAAAALARARGQS